MNALDPIEVCRRRIIEEFTASKRRATIRAYGRVFTVRYDDVLDLVQAVEMIMLKLTGKVLRPKFRAPVKNRAALRITNLVGGDYSLYTGGDATMPEHTICDVTAHMVRTHYMRIEIEGNVWEQWFGRLDELVKCLYIVIREAQGDPYVPAPMVRVANG